MRRSPQTASALCGFAMLTVAAVAAVAAPAVAGDQPSAPDATRGTLDRTATVITVGEMCGGCVKRIEATLKPVKGIAKVSCDIETNTVTVLPDPRVKLSPKWLWEAMESIGKTPKRLAGPSGTFTKKPKA